MKLILKKYYWVLVILIFFVAFPLAVELGITYMPGNGSNDGWLGFWGSYLGSIPSGLIAYIVAKKQIDAEKNNYRKNHLEDMLLNDLRAIYLKLINLSKLAEISKFSDNDMDLIGKRDLNNIVNEAKKYKTISVEVVDLVNNIPNYFKKEEIKRLSKKLSNSIEIICNVSDTLEAKKSVSDLSVSNYQNNPTDDNLKRWKLDKDELVRESNRIKLYTREIEVSYNKLKKCILKEENKLSSF